MSKYHPFDLDSIRALLDDDRSFVPTLMVSARTDAERLGVFQQFAFAWACRQAAIDPASPDLHKALTWSMQAAVAIIALGPRPGEVVELPLGDGPPVTFTRTGPTSVTNARRWLEAFRLAAIVRDHEGMARVCETPTTVLQASSTRADDYAFRYVDALRALWNRERGVDELLAAALEATDPDGLEFKDPDYVIDIVVPEMEVFLRILEGDAAKVDAALEKAVRRHREYWSTEERQQDCDGFIALGPLAMATLAQGRGLQVTIESDYLPAALLRGPGRPSTSREVAPPLLQARSNAEAHLFMDLRPCRCGDARFERRSRVVTRGDALCSEYTGRCTSCGTARTFVFELPDEIVAPGPGDRVRFGGADPSRLLDPGEWLAVADERARRHPADPPPSRRAEARADLATAVAAIEEVLKFVPAGADRVPDDEFTSARGRAVRDAEPGRFRHARLEAVLGAYRGLLARISERA